ncbi:LysE family transporter [Glycomyces rhizosphaerae]|uniref:LysE family transporter n=1 Tax=Glycomyces rhizosphaerae TaxID=2054422 RepID=A0ABV7Q5J1_9ACTN
MFLLFLALLPQFTDPDASWPVALQIIVLGLVHTATCAVVYSVVGVCAQRVLKTRPTAARWTVRISGAALIVIAAALLTEQLVA